MRQPLLAGLRHPGQVIAIAFAAAIAAGTGLLSLPIATETGEPAPFVDALFTATSAICVTGLITVDTPTYWSTFGEVVIMGLFQIGGLGIMTLATLLMLLISRRLGMRAKLIAQAETRTVSARDIARVVRNIVLFTLISEVIVTIVLTTRFILAYDRPLGAAAYDGLFHAISAFNNAGFSLNSNSLMDYVADPWVSLTIVAAFVIGGLGFPVVFELARTWRRPSRWSVVTRITVWTTVALLTVGTLTLTSVEYSNPDTLAPLSGPAKLLAGFFAAATARTAGFNTIDYAAMTPEGWLATDILMFIGGGSAGTAGGIKVTTFGLLAFVIWSELQGEPNVHIGHRRIPGPNQRQAVTIALLGVGLVALSSFFLMALTNFTFDQVLFEAISAFGTVGLSTGITGGLPEPAKLLITALMFVGRVGPLTLFSALALREKTRRYELPEERTIVG